MNECISMKTFGFQGQGRDAIVRIVKTTPTLKYHGTCNGHVRGGACVAKDGGLGE
jgi:hypothetical protein